MTPEKLSKADLIRTLQQMARLVENDDSFEGNIEYSCMQEGCERGEFMVSAVFRVGNSEGQGGCHIIGDQGQHDT